jgi:hypothetical protein
MSSVSVVVAHRGRITVRVQPNTSLQQVSSAIESFQRSCFRSGGGGLTRRQVLDEVCSKASLDANKHMLM